jgi:hypothetical protein
MKPLLIGALAVIGLLSCACSTPPTAAQPVRTVTITVRPPATHSPATPTPSSPTRTPIAAACQAKDLNGAIGASPVGTANGGLEVVIVFRNLRAAPCTLSGYPGVRQASGTPPTDIGQPARANLSTPRTLVTLPPGGFASATLKIANAANYLAVKCKAVKATWLRVTPPGQRTPFNISFGTTACQGTAKLMSVTSLVQGSAG